MEVITGIMSTAWLKCLRSLIPFPVGGYNDIWRPCHLSQVFSSIADPSDIETLMLRSGINFPGSLPNNAYWGESYEGGSTSIPMLNIPSAPILSMASFSPCQSYDRNAATFSCRW
jgi:hypothetical protein